MRAGHLMRMLGPDLLGLVCLRSYGYFRMPKEAANGMLQEHSVEPRFFNMNIVGATHSKRGREFEKMDCEGLSNVPQHSVL